MSHTGAGSDLSSSVASFQILLPLPRQVSRMQSERVSPTAHCLTGVGTFYGRSPTWIEPLQRLKFNYICGYKYDKFVDNQDFMEFCASFPTFTNKIFLANFLRIKMLGKKMP